MNQVATRERSAVHELRDQFHKMGSEFKAALPAHIPPERFQRVAMTAVQRNPQLLNADRKSLIQACMMAAQDGLVPDNREAVLVTFGKTVQYMPMVFGIRKKVYQSGEITSLVARIAYENDEFDVFYGDDERIEHKPNLFSRGNMIAAYAVAIYRDGSKAREVMTIDDIEQIRSISKNPNSGPWKDWYEEMAKKTVIRRLSKSLPLSAELDDFMRRDDGFYDLERNRPQVETVRPARPQTIEARLDAFAGDAALPEPSADVTTADVSPPESTQPTATEGSGTPSAPSEAIAPAQADDGADTHAMQPKLAEAMDKGRGARRSGYGRELPKNLQYKTKADEAEAFLRGWDEENQEIQAEEAGTV